MEDTSTPNKLYDSRRICLIAGIVILLISVGIILPIEKSTSSFISEFIYTYFTLTLALFLCMFGLMGASFFKGILVLLASIFLGFSLVYLVIPLGALGAIYIGIPSGIVAAIAFFFINFFFLKDVIKYKVLKKIITYFIILAIVAILFMHGGDWLFEIEQYFK